MIDARELKRLMDKVAIEVGVVIDSVLMVKVLKDVNLEIVVKDQEIVFQLMSKNSKTRDFAHHSKSNQTVPCLPLVVQIDAPSATYAWASWRSVWQSRGRGPKNIAMFEFVEASWLFFLGWQHQAKEQVLRAEWANHQCAIAKSGQAPQPHWHVDASQLLPQSIFGEAGAAIEQELEGLAALHSGLHLGMAGWGDAKNRTASPGCWQRDVGADYSQLVLWTELALLSARNELEHLKVRSGSV